MAGNIQYFCNRMVYWCLEVSLGYDQSNRQDFRHMGETDCSALVIHCAKEAGFDVGSASYTGNMRAQFTQRGWTVKPNNGNPQVGDILLNDINHVAVYIGNGKLAQASIDERGKISGGQGGDQTGRETNVSNYYNYPWNCYLRWTGSGSSGSTVTNNKLVVDGSWGPSVTRRLQEYCNLSSRDGEVSHQYKENCNQFIYAAQFDRTLIGSQLIREMQKRLKAKGFYQGTTDGLCGTETIKALQRAFKTTVDGFISPESDLVKAMQRALNANKLPF